ncbi:MAG: alkaline phosphatase family protein [Actinomycetota bacterium]|nr:alkaline phosphatase family protein [Actinomycetota bacterium]
MPPALGQTWRWVVVLIAGSVVACGCARGPARLRPPEPAAIPIDHVVVLMQENRSFDSYLGQLHASGQPQAEPEPATAANPDPTNPAGPAMRAFHQDRYCEVADLEHSWTGAHREWNGGAMDGFTAANVTPADPTGSRAMGYYSQADLPYYYGLYSTFAMADRYFSSVLGPTFPNRFFLLAGTSFGHIRNDLPPLGGFTQRSVFNLLDEASVSWRYYYSDFLPFAEEFSYVRAHAAGHLVPISQYYADAAAGQLPQVSFVDPLLAGSAAIANDEHPPSNVQVGEAFAAGVIDSLFRSPQWPSSALFLAYDEDGGFYDHVPPPVAPVPDAIAPMLRSGDIDSAFDRYGLRVPAVVVSPYARAHFVSHTVYDHTSILRFIETRFGLPSLSQRDAHADPMLGMFDFTRMTFAAPPPLPPTPVDPAPQPGCPGSPGGGGR